MKKFCAHRGVSALMPENTLPAFGAALALGADEIEFDVRLTKDEKLIVSHDPVLERISDSQGNLSAYTLEELRQLNIGGKYGWHVSFCTPEEVFDHFANRMTFNIHLKECGEDGFIPKELMKLVKRYNAYGHVYFAAAPREFGDVSFLRQVSEVPCVAIQFPRDTVSIYDAAKQFGCAGVQFWLGMFDEELIEKLHSDGIFCNLFYADTEEDYEKYFNMGVDTLLTNRMDLAAKYRAEK